jgi:hypothetical protein
MASGADLWPVPNSPYSKASGTADTVYRHGTFVDSWGQKVSRIVAYTDFAFQGLAPGAHYALCCYNKYGERMTHFDFYSNLDGTVSDSGFEVYDNIDIKFVRYAYYELRTADDRGNPVTLVLSSR